MTKRAAVYLLVVLTLLVIALSTGAQIYYLFCFAMLTALLLCLFSVILSAATLRIKLKGVRTAVERGASVPLSAVVRHAAALPVKSITLRLSIPDTTGELADIALDAAPFRTRAYKLSLTCPHRGVYPIGVTSALVTDVLGLLRYEKKLNRCSFQVEVAPRTREVPPMALGTGGMEDNRIARMTEDNASPADLRDWREGDPLKKIHWKLSMRRRELLVRTYEESARPDMLLLIDLYPVPTLASQRLTIEDAVCETAATIARAQLADGCNVRMPLFAKTPTELSGDQSAALGAFLGALTRVSFDSPYPFEQVITLETRRMQRTGGAVLITPRLSPQVADLALQLRQGGMSVFVIWITDNRRDEATQMLSRLESGGVRARAVDPWSDGLTAETVMGQVRAYG